MATISLFSIVSFDCFNTVGGFRSNTTDCIRLCTAGPATKVAITVPSVGTQRGAAFTTQPQVTIQDAKQRDRKLHQQLL
jgi:hypothetical protein